MMKNIRILDDLGVVPGTVCKVICDCGWTEKFFKMEVVKKAEAHLKGKHNGGLVKYGDETREVA
jgi:hypothetical protein